MTRVTRGHEVREAGPFLDIVTAIGAPILRRLADSWMAEAASLRKHGGRRKKRYEWHAIIAEQHARELAAVIGLPYPPRIEPSGGDPSAEDPFAKAED